MVDVAQKLAFEGYTLRSGGADGADRFWEEGAREIYSNIPPEIYIPWAGFNGNKGQCFTVFDKLDKGIQTEAIRIAMSVHPSPSRVKDSVKKLHARNVLQCLGMDLSTPSKFLLCYADINKEGKPKGGTRVAWEVAKLYNIPVFNLYFEDVYKRLEGWVNE